MPKHETFSALMNAGMAWGAIVGVLVFFAEESNRFLIGGISSIFFWTFVGIYFYLDYRTTHKKIDSPLISPLPYKVAEPKPAKGSSKKWIFIKNTFFIVLGIAESAYCLSLILLWEMVTIPVGDSAIPVLTYQNGFLLIIFVIGLYIALIIASRLRHPRKAFFEE